jgi:uncharacterized C2H2 Zn-finger protein
LDGLSATAKIDLTEALAHCVAFWRRPGIGKPIFRCGAILHARKTRVKTHNKTMSFKARRPVPVDLQTPKMMKRHQAFAISTVFNPI